MIIMTWVRNDQGSFTVYPARPPRTQMNKLLKERWIETMQRVYCHEQTALFLYRSLAERTDNPSRRKAFLALAASQERQLQRRQQMLLRLNAAVPCQSQTPWRRLWLRLLLRLGPSSVMFYIKRIKRRDLHCQMRLVEMVLGMTGFHLPQERNSCHGPDPVYAEHPSNRRFAP